jgi:hypothetical protein
MDEAIRSATIIAAARLVLLMSGLFMALVPMSAQSAESLEEKPTMIKQIIAVEHIRIESAKSFADVRAALERSVPRLDPGLVKALDDGDVERADREKKEGPELSIFQVRDHGAVLKIAGKARNALQYDIGNPVTASLMVRYQLAAALYPPIRVVLYESAAGHGVMPMCSSWSRHQLAGLNDVSGLGAIRAGNRRQVRCGNRYSASPGM